MDEKTLNHVFLRRANEDFGSGEGESGFSDQDTVSAAAVMEERFRQEIGEEKLNIEETSLEEGLAVIEAKKEAAKEAYVSFRFPPALHEKPEHKLISRLLILHINFLKEMEEMAKQEVKNDN